MMRRQDTTTTTTTTTSVGGDQIHHAPSLWVELARAAKNGGGMFVESYFVFAVGNLTALWTYLHPTCTSKVDHACYEALSALPYTEVAGIIIAQLSFGFIADVFGRVNGSRLTSTLMLVGVVVEFGQRRERPKTQVLWTWTRPE